ncbi:MAG: hydroxyethylthiazole kinase [Rhabdaerophilum calidifontis]
MSDELAAGAASFHHVYDRPHAARRIAAILAAMRGGRKRIHVITSPVAQPLSANGMLALGLQPSMTSNPEEIADLVGVSDAVLLNLGMLDRERFESLPRAAATARARGIPFLVDPVKAERSPRRRALAEELLAAGPAILKVNAAEAAVFAPLTPPGTSRLVRAAIDRLRHGARMAELANGTPRLDQVTATGCLLGAILAGCLAVEPDPFAAAIAGVAILTIAAEIAAEDAPGPGSFAVRLLDALAALDDGAIESRLRLDLFQPEGSQDA